MKRLIIVIALAVALPPIAFTQTSDPAPTKKTAADGGVINGSLGREIDAYLADFASRGFSGAVMVARNDELVLLKGYGTADRGSKLPATHRTLLHLGSVTKQFTAAAILKLEMEGKLKVSDPIARHLKDVPPDKRAITIHHLLTHTSGLPEHIRSCSSREAGVGRDDYARQVLSAGLQSEPGQAHLYSNDGYGLLGVIIEVVSGEPYDQYLRKHLLEPAGMSDTGYSFDEARRARVARGYKGDREYRGVMNDTIRSASGPAWCIRASGGLLSTAEDMHKWYLALRGARILSARAKDRLFFPHVAEQPERTSFYGYGWALFTTSRGTRLIAHNGSVSEYFTADLRMYADEGVAFFVAANTAEHSAEEASAGIAKIIFPHPKGKAGQ